MITEKGMNDTAWCPVLWLETKGNSKRIKPGRDWDPMERIQKALITGVNNKGAIIEDVGLARKAESYSGDFWLHIPHVDVGCIDRPHEEHLFQRRGVPTDAP